MKKKCKKKEKEGGRKKKGRGKGGRKKEGGKISFFTGALYTFYVHSTILKISTPAAGRQLGFFLASLEKNRPGGLDFFFPAGALCTCAGMECAMCPYHDYGG